jgi:prepilin-type N-terminal cleavage/methylation domain-containing protein/prepilin-type processing-associated H-X9-DG protein
MPELQQRSHFVRSRGYSLVELLVAVAIISLLLGLVLPAVQKVRDASLRASCQSNLRQIGLGLHEYHSAYGAFPPGVASQVVPGIPKVFTPVIPWHALILAHIGEGTLAANMAEAYRIDAFQINSPPHTARNTVVKIYVCPTEAKGVNFLGVGITSYMGCSGLQTANGEGILYYDSRTRLSDVTDGTSNTLIAGERPPALDWLGTWYGGWAHAQDGVATNLLGVEEVNRGYDAKCNDRVMHYRAPRSPNDGCRAFHYWSKHTNGANFLFADGSVRLLRYSARDVMPMLATRAEGEVVDVP